MATLKTILTGQLLGKTVKSEVDTEIDNIGTLVDRALVPANRLGTLTTRTNGTQGVITVTDMASYIITGDEIGIGWLDPTTGELKSRINVSTSVSGSLVTVSLGTGDDLPLADAEVRIGKMATYGIAYPSNAYPLIAGVEQGQGVMLLDTAAHIGSPSYTESVIKNFTGPNDGLVVRDVNDWAALNSSFVSADTCLFANLSKPAAATYFSVIPTLA